MSGRVRPIALVVFVGMSLATAQAVTIDTVPVGNLGNVGELSGEGAGGNGYDRVCGQVGYHYEIGKYEITAGQYAEFLTAVASNNWWLDLYTLEMEDNQRGCKIRRIGSAPDWYYIVDADGDGVEDADWVDRPVNYISWSAAARFANWMHNGQPTGDPGPTTTEDGSYFLNFATEPEDLQAVMREPDATWVIPSEDEWYKAAYHLNNGPTGDYYLYPMQSDSTPDNQVIDPDAGNSANFWSTCCMANTGTYFRSEVGEYENSPSPYGTFDQGGNVTEWTDTIVPVPADYPDPNQAAWRVKRGGSFSWTGSFDQVLRADNRNYSTGSGGYEAGFRLAFVGFDPVPAVSEWGMLVMAIVLLSVGTIAFRRTPRDIAVAGHLTSE